MSKKKVRTIKIRTVELNDLELLAFLARLIGDQTIREIWQK